MGAKRTEYAIVGRFMDGNEVTGYYLQSLESNKSGKYTREQVAYLVGRGQVVNCEGQLYKDKVLFRGKGMNIDDLPVQLEDGSLTRTDGIGHIRRGASAEDVMAQLTIIGAYTQGRSVVGYEVRNAGGQQKSLSKKDVYALASQGKIGNARVQQYNGKVILRGVGCDLSQLPTQPAN